MLTPGVKVGHIGRGAALDRAELAAGKADWNRGHHAVVVGNADPLVQLVLKHLVHGRQAGAQPQGSTG